MPRGAGCRCPATNPHSSHRHPRRGDGVCRGTGTADRQGSSGTAGSPGSRDYAGIPDFVGASRDRQQQDADRRQHRHAQNTRTSHLGSGSRNHLKATATAAKRTASPAQAPMRTWITAAPPGATVIADSATRARTKRAQRYQEILMMVMASPFMPSRPGEHRLPGRQVRSHDAEDRLSSRRSGRRQRQGESPGISS